MNRPEWSAGTTLPDWRVYERIAAAMESENLGAGIDITSTLNARIIGAMSGVERQIDLLVEARWDHDRVRRILVDAKHYGRPLNVKDIEAFEGMMRDCRAEHGILVCTQGWSRGAEQRARELITLKLLTLEDALQTAEWATFEECFGRCQRTPDPRLRGVTMWDGQLPLSLDGLWAIVWTGKCDVCHSFQVWCWDCGEKFALALGETHTCGCERQWSALILDEAATSATQSRTAVHLLLRMGNEVISIDRRSLT